MGYTGDKKRQYQLAWKDARRKEWLDEHGPCIECGTWDDLEIDHKDPSLKEIKISAIWSLTKVKRDRELAKCQVLCRQCHYRKSATDNGKVPGGHHGIPSTYTSGCRCNECKLAHMVNMQDYRARKKTAIAISREGIIAKGRANILKLRELQKST